MQKLRACFSLLIVVGLAAAAPAAEGTVGAYFQSSQPLASANSYALDFAATNLDGSPFHASALKGRIVLLDFWAVWCPPCIAAFPILSRLDQDFRNQAFQVLGIAVYSGTTEDVAAFIEDRDVDYAVVLGDDDLVERFGVIGYPTYFLISSEGAIYKQYVGEMPDLYEEVSSDLATLRESRDP